MSVQFVNVKVSFTPHSGSEVSTQCLLDIDGLGSSREVNKLKCLNDHTIVAVSSKDQDTLNFKVPYDETANGFMEVVQAAYDSNTIGLLEIEFDNMPDGGSNGTTISGSAYITSAKLTNDSKVLTNSFSADWEGSVTRAKAS
jgi:hypothetical protein